MNQVILHPKIISRNYGNNIKKICEGRTDGRQQRQYDRQPESYATHISMHFLRRLGPLFQQTCKSKITYVITNCNLMVTEKIH
jgi:hypothetical protein